MFSDRLSGALIIADERRTSFREALTDCSLITPPMLMGT
jgi:hypothetical protein